MAADMIDEILKAEARARQLEAKAQKAGDKIIEQAELQADIIIKSAVEQAENQANIILSDAQYSSDGVIHQAVKLAEMRERKSINDTEKLYEKAIELIFEAILN